MTECKQVLIQPGERRRSTGHKINSQIECTIIRKIQTCLEMFKSFIPPQTDGMICFHSNIGCSESKVIFKWGKKTTTKTKKSLYEEQTFAPRVISFRLSQKSHTRQTNAGDKGCAEACAERFSALKDQHWRHSLQSIRGHFGKVFVKSSEMLGFWSFIFL